MWYWKKWICPLFVFRNKKVVLDFQLILALPLPLHRLFILTTLLITKKILITISYKIEINTQFVLFYHVSGILLSIRHWRMGKMKFLKMPQNSVAVLTTSRISKKKYRKNWGKVDFFQNILFNLDSKMRFFFSFKLFYHSLVFLHSFWDFLQHVSTKIMLEFPFSIRIWLALRTSNQWQTHLDEEFAKDFNIHIV